MVTSLLRSFIKIAVICGGFVLVSVPALAITKISCTVVTSQNTAGHVEVLPIQTDRFEITDNEEFDTPVTIAGTPFSYTLYVGFTEDPAYDEMSDEGTPGFTPQRTIRGLTLSDRDKLWIQTYNNRFERHTAIGLGTNAKNEKGFLQMSISCYSKLLPPSSSFGQVSN